LLIPRGAEVAGRISRLETRRDRQGEYVVIGIRILTVSWEGHVHEFQGSLEDVGIEVGTSVRNRFYAPFASNPNSRWPWFRVTFAPPFPGEGVFCARGAPARITTPLRTVWRTGEGAAQP
jgi:hypothetical protein